MAAVNVKRRRGKVEEAEEETLCNEMEWTDGGKHQDLQARSSATGILGEYPLPVHMYIIQFACGAGTTFINHLPTPTQLIGFCELIIYNIRDPSNGVITVIVNLAKKLKSPKFDQFYAITLQSILEYYET